MRILHCITGLTGDGAQRILLHLARGLKEHSIRSFVVNLGASTPLVQEFESSQIPVISLNISPRVFHVSRAVTSIRRVMRELQPDIIQGWMYHANVVALMAGVAKKKRVPVVWNVRRGMEDYRERSRATRAVIRLSSKLSSYVDSVIYCSAICRAQHETYGYHPHHGRVMYNGVDTLKFAPSEKARREARLLLGAHGDEVVIGNIGRFDVAKGHRYLLEAFALVAARYRNVRLVCVGRGMDGSNRELVDLLSRAGIVERVVFLGECGSVERIFSGFDLYCSSSINEGFPNVIAEAMACGLPCVVTNVGGTTEVVGDSGMVVPPRDSHALAEGLRGYVRLSTIERRTIGERARARVCEEFSLEAMVKRYAELYSELGSQPHFDTPAERSPGRLTHGAESELAIEKGINFSSFGGFRG